MATSGSTWLAALDARATTPANWVAIGESVTEGQGASTRAKRWLDLLATKLRSSFPTPAAPHGATYLPAVYRVYSPDSTWGSPWSDSSGDVSAQYWAGDLGYRELDLDTNASVTYQVTGSSADIWYLRSPYTAAFTYQVDDGAAVSVDTYSTAPWTTANRAQNITLGPAGVHTITVRATTGPVYLEGFTVYDGTSSAGIGIYDSGSSGATVSTFLADLTNFQATVAAVGPQLITIELGANDYVAQTDPATFTSQMQQLITSLEQLPTDPSIELIAPYQVYDASKVEYSYQTYVRQLQDLAAADPAHLTFLDLSASMPAATTRGTGYYRTDGLHPNNVGQRLIEKLVYASITE